MPVTEPDEHKTPQNPDVGDPNEARWLWVRIGVRLGIGLLVVVATLLLIFSAG